MKLLPRLFPSRRPASASDVVGMIVEQECAWFRSYAAGLYSGAGAIVDLGCFVGSTTISLAQGLRQSDCENCENPRLRSLPLGRLDEMLVGSKGSSRA
jgi:hypothetical protein